MPQLSLYVDQMTLEKVEMEAKKENLSISKWVVNKVLDKIDPGFPLEYEKLVGCIEDNTFERPKNLDWSYDAAREQL